jgi:hypothetical protein
MAQSNDGINPYAPTPVSEEFHEMIEDGRARVAMFLENPTGASNVKHEVVFNGVVAEGNNEMDKFRVTSQTPTGFTPVEETRIQRYSPKPFARGANARTIFVFFPHDKYDRNVKYFDMSLSGLLSTLFLAVIAGICLYAAHELDIFTVKAATAVAATTIQSVP